MILSDFGAEVIRIERPVEVEPVSQQGVEHPIWNFNKTRQVADKALNRNKKSMILNFRLEKARQVFYELAKTADVIVEGFRPGVTKRLGIDYETIKGGNPKVIYCSMSGYGQDGPYANLPGHDINYISVGGVLDMIGESGKPPVIPLNFIADWSGAALNTVIGILLAITARDKTGRGQYVDISYTDGVISLSTLFAYNCLNNKVSYSRGNTPLSGTPGYNAYETKDKKYISIGCFEPWFWENLCLLAGREDFIPYQQTEGEKEQEIYTYFKQFFLTKTRDEWFDIIKEKNIPVGNVYTLDEVFSDPQVLHRQMLVELDGPNGKERAAGVGIKLTDTPGEIRTPAPSPGEHTREILLSIGCSEDELKELGSY